MRHVIEHNEAWGRILDNAVASFTERMVLILFTPERATTEAIAFHPDLGVPDIAFRLADLTDRFPHRRDVYGATTAVGHPVWRRDDPPSRAVPDAGVSHRRERARA